MRRPLTNSLLPLLLLTSVLAVERPYQAGRISDIEQRVSTRVLYYIVNTPVTQDDPYYEVSVQLKNIVYIGQYTPRHSADALPLGWEVGADVQVRIEKNTMFVKRPQGQELQLAVTKRSPMESQPSKVP